MDVSLDQIRAFVKAAEANDPGRTAAHVGLPHPALTTQIHQLECILQMRVLEPQSDSIQLTEAGWKLLPVCKRLLEQFDAAVTHAKSLELHPSRTDPHSRSE